MFKHTLRAIVLALLAYTAFAQVTTGRIDGVVQDPSGAVISGAKVTATEVKTQISSQTTTDSSGNYAFVSLPPGFYSVSVEASGFRKEVLNDLELAVAATVSNVVKLQVGTSTESVTVDAIAPSVQTTDTQVGSALTMKSVDDLPQLARTPITLAMFQPGVQIDVRAGQDASFSHVNGLRQGSNNSTLDGIDVNDSVAPRMGLSLTANNTDSVEQVSVLTSGFNPEYGRSAGSEIQLVTRSGTNEFHGNAFDYLRNTDFNANDWFNNQSGGATPQFVQNIYGGSFGGPIRKNKTFIFGNFQGRRTHQQTVHEREVPTMTARQGIFEWADSTGVHQYNIASNDPLHIGIDSAVAKLLAQYPAPNNFNVGDGLNTAGFQFNNPVPSLEDQFTIKGDHRINDNNALFLRWSWERNSSIDNLNSADATFPGQPQGSQGGHRWGFSAGYTATIGATMVNNFTAGHQSASVMFNRPNRPDGPVILFQSGWTSIPFTGFAQGRNSPVNQFNDTLAKTWGKHTFKVGANLEFTQQYGYNYSGVFPNISTAVANGASVPASLVPAGLTSGQATTFNNLYNDLLGRVSSVALTYYSNLATYQTPGTPLSHTLNYNYYGFFAQDEWRVNRKLTLNYGVRWDYYGIPHEINGQQGILSQAAMVNGVNNIDNLTIQKSGQWYNKDLNNFAPRFGFAYDPFGDGKTAIRGGYGIFYDRTIGAAVSDVDQTTPGFSYAATVFPDANGADTRYSQGYSIPTTPSPTPTLTPAATRGITSVYLINPNLRDGYVESYNLTIQRQLPWNNTLQIGYVGNEGIKLFFDRNVNQPVITPAFQTAFTQLAAYATSTGNAVPPGNLFVQAFGSPAAAVSAVGASNLTLGNVGTVINTLDVSNYAKLQAAGYSEYYFRHYPQFQNVLLGTNDGRSYYNSLQVRFVHNSRNLQVAMNYTYSKSMDNISAEGNGFTSVVDNYNERLNRAVSDYDRPHSLNAYFTYTLPVGAGQKFGSSMPKVLDSLIGGWNLGGYLIDQSGNPFSVSSQHSTLPGGTTYATFTGASTTSFGGLYYTGSGPYYYTPAQVADFTTTPAFGVGNSGRNVFRNPWFNELDLSLIKSFKITERQKVSFRAEAFNVFNHPNFGFTGANLNITTPASFGRFSTTLGTQNGSTSARTMQLALRYDF